MSLERQLHEIEMNGFTVVENVIPTAAIPSIIESLEAAHVFQAKKHEAELARTRSRGHRVGNKGVSLLRQVINEVQTFAPYLADRRILDLAEALLGSFVRISSTACAFNLSGTNRGYWHADWPHNQTNASHIKVPYPDALVHMATIWMLTPFSVENGGTFVIPGSHRMANNPAASEIPFISQDAPYLTEMQITGSAGSALVYDSRLWHAVAPNNSNEARLALIVRYAPWWLNLNPTMIGSPEHTMMVVETGGKNYESVPVRAEVYESLPDAVKPLYRHWVG